MRAVRSRRSSAERRPTRLSSATRSEATTATIDVATCSVMTRLMSSAESSCAFTLCFVVPIECHDLHVDDRLRERDAGVDVVALRSVHGARAAAGDERRRRARDELMRRRRLGVDGRQHGRERNARLRFGATDLGVGGGEIGGARAHELDGVLPRADHLLRGQRRHEHRVVDRRRIRHRERRGRLTGGAGAREGAAWSAAPCVGWTATGWTGAGCPGTGCEHGLCAGAGRERRSERDQRESVEALARGDSTRGRGEAQAQSDGIPRATDEARDSRVPARTGVSRDGDRWRWRGGGPSAPARARERRARERPAARRPRRRGGAYRCRRARAPSRTSG